MKSLLEKISWLTRRWNFKFRVFDLYLRDEFGVWGFELLTIEYNYRAYSALAFLFKLPNKTNVSKFTVEDWDFLFLERPLWNWCENLSEKRLWGNRLSFFEKIALNILNKIVK